MKTKNKILLTILPVLIITILAVNVSFVIFFQDFILESEREKIYISADSISTYLSEISINYQGTVNDWAHWDDTYDFIENSNQNYIDSNLTASALQSIDVNFMFFLSSNDSIIHQIYFNSDDEVISQIPTSVLENIKELIAFSRIGDDAAGILNIGNDYYFIASSHITDSLETKSTKGKLIIGREIDAIIIAQMEKVSGIDITQINGLDDVNRLSESDTSNVLKIEYDEVANNPINIEVVVPNNYDLNHSIVISMVMQRALYIRGIKQALDFTLFYTSISLVISLIIFLLIGKFITKPFTSLINDVKAIDISKANIHGISESGKDEFSFLRRTINALMLRISSTQEELIKSREEMYSTLLSIGEGIIAVDKSNNINFINLVAQKMTGWKLEESLNKDLDTILIVKRGNNEIQAGSLADGVFEKGDIIKFSNDIKLFAKDGSPLDVEITVAPIKYENEETVRCVIVINDITDSLRKQRDIEYLSYRDILTGVYNRSFYEEKIKEFEVKEKGTVSLIIIDLNGLKLINDAFGHETGDLLLIKVAECIEKSIRTDDIICRIGGDEFAILLPDIEPKETIQIINRMYIAIEKEKIKNIPISISSGWATKQQAEKMESVFKRAEDIMYHNKSSTNKNQRYQTIQIVLNTLFERNPREEKHSIQVSNICLLIGEHLNLDFSRMKNLQTAALLHDVGKIGIDSSCLEKAGPLNKEEWIEIRKHPQISHNILSSSNEHGPLADIVLHHHERWDGTGYPSGLKGEEIPLESRIITIADAYDAMINDRPYRSGLRQSEVLLIIKNEAGKQFDPEIVKIFLEKIMIEG